jgi:hypothetical protein
VHGLQAEARGNVPHSYCGVHAAADEPSAITADVDASQPVPAWFTDKWVVKVSTRTNDSDVFVTCLIQTFFFHALSALNLILSQKQLRKT